MLDDQFTKLFIELVKIGNRLESLETSSATKDQVGAVYDLLSKNIAEHERQEQERAAMGHQLDRHSKHIEQLADHTSLKLHYE